jgi:tetratricopeptide (TPR) repeat protein/DNA-directed RNA polymerase specialized sigma24 family protein
MGDAADSSTSVTLLGLLGGPDRDEQAWRAFCGRYKPLIGHRCRRWPLQAADVEDVTQKVLQRVFTKINTYDPGRGGFRGWLKAVVENAVKDFLRGLNRRPADRGSGDSAVAELLQARPEAVVAEVVAALDEWASELGPRGQPAARRQRLASLAQALDDERGSKRGELRAMLARGNLARERAVCLLSAALRPVPVPCDVGWGEDRARLRQVAATSAPAAEPTLRLLTLVRALRVAGDRPVAVNLLRVALRARPQEVMLYHTLGQLLEEQKRWQEAAECYTAARALRPELGATLAEALVYAGRVRDGLALFERLKARQPDNPWLHVEHAIVLYHLGRYTQAEAVFHRAHQLKPDYPLHITRSSLLRDLGRHQEAEEVLREAIRLKPDDYAAYNNLANNLHIQGKDAEAEKICREAIRLKADNFLAHTNLGLVLGALGRHREAEAACREAIRLKPDYPPPYNNLGKALSDQGNYADAAEVFREAIRLQPDYPLPRTNLGIALAKLGRYQEAAAAFRGAIQLKSDHPKAPTDLGLALNGPTRQAVAERTIRQAIDLLAEVLFMQGSSLNHQGRHKEAEAVLREAAQLKPDNPLVLNDLGWALNGLGQHKEAEETLREAIRLKADDPWAHTNLGIALQKQGKFKEAEAACREAIRLQKDLPLAHCALGEALAAQGRFPDALAAFRRGHALGSLTPGWSYRSADWVRRCEQLVALDTLLAKVLRGEAEPATAAERLSLAYLCQFPCKRLHAAAARLAADAFAADPKLADDGKQQHRYHAACSAALAGCGKGEDAVGLDEKERARLRQQARDWLTADLAFWTNKADGDPKAREQVGKTLQQWQNNPAFAGIREREALAVLADENERDACRKLWAAVAAAQKKAAGQP